MEECLVVEWASELAVLPCSRGAQACQADKPGEGLGKDDDTSSSELRIELFPKALVYESTDFVCLGALFESRVKLQEETIGFTKYCASKAPLALRGHELRPPKAPPIAAIRTQAIPGLTHRETRLLCC